MTGVHGLLNYPTNERRNVFESKQTINYKRHLTEAAALAAAYELLINTNISIDRAREYFLADYPDYLEVFEEVVQECQDM